MSSHRTCWLLKQKCPRCPHGELATDDVNVWCIRRGCEYRTETEREKVLKSQRTYGKKRAARKP